MFGMLPVTVNNEDEQNPPDYCIDLRDQCPHTLQDLTEVSVPAGTKIKYAKVGPGATLTTVVGPATLNLNYWSKYTFLMAK